MNFEIENGCPFAITGYIYINMEVCCYGDGINHFENDWLPLPGALLEPGTARAAQTTETAICTYGSDSVSPGDPAPMKINASAWFGGTEDNPPINTAVESANSYTLPELDILGP